MHEVISHFTAWTQSTSPGFCGSYVSDNPINGEVKNVKQRPMLQRVASMIVPQSLRFVYISSSSSYNCPLSKLNSLLSSSPNLCQISRNSSRLPPSQCPQSKPPHTLSPSLSLIGKHVANGSEIEPFFQRRSWSGKTSSRPDTSTRKRQMMAARRRAYRIVGGKRSSGAASLSASRICRCYVGRYHRQYEGADRSFRI